MKWQRWNDEPRGLMHPDDGTGGGMGKPSTALAFSASFLFSVPRPFVEDEWVL
jgi:hypothetical protein